MTLWRLWWDQTLWKHGYLYVHVCMISIHNLYIWIAWIGLPKLWYLCLHTEHLVIMTAHNFPIQIAGPNGAMNHAPFYLLGQGPRSWMRTNSKITRIKTTLNDHQVVNGCGGHQVIHLGWKSPCSYMENISIFWGVHHLSHASDWGENSTHLPIFVGEESLWITMKIPWNIPAVLFGPKNERQQRQRQPLPCLSQFLQFPGGVQLGIARNRWFLWENPNRTNAGGWQGGGTPMTKRKAPKMLRGSSCSWEVIARGGRNWPRFTSIFDNLPPLVPGVLGETSDTVH